MVEMRAREVERAEKAMVKCKKDMRLKYVLIFKMACLCYFWGVAIIGESSKYVVMCFYALNVVFLLEFDFLCT